VRVLLDTNVVLDVLLRRGAWLTEAAVIWEASADGRLSGCVTASAMTDIYYIARKLSGADAARRAVRQCLDSFVILAMDRDDLEAAYASSVADPEDALQIACAARHGLDALVTRDPAGFPAAPVPVWSPSDLIAHVPPPVTGP
jgi:predicted nucleic acid-binding protein